MELKLNYTHKSSDACGIFVENHDMMSWITVASRFTDPNIRFYPVPGSKANTIAGALLITNHSENIEQYDFQKIQRLGNCLYLINHSAITPILKDDEINKRFDNTPHFFHPIYGLIELHELTDWSSYLALQENEQKCVIPEDAMDIPNKLGNYFIREVPPEKVLESLLEKSVPERKSLKSNPLTSWEKIKLRALRGLLKKTSQKEGSKKAGSNDSTKASVNASSTRKKPWWKRKRAEMEEQLENLEERNKKELDKLMDMLDKDPDEALKYALPIDRSGYSRGPEVGFTMTNRFKGSFINSGSSGGGGSVNIGDDYNNQLRNKYRAMADQYVKDGNWEKASFVYMELLSDPHQAASVLERGKRYEAAAAMFLSKCKNKTKAAECYENGRFYSRAIDLYEELDQQMKVGDLHTKIGNDTKAKSAYNKEVDKMVGSKRFFDAGNLTNDKLVDLNRAREYYMEGWNQEVRYQECLNAYLETYDLNNKRKEIQELHGQDFTGRKAHKFIDVLKVQYASDADIQKDIEPIVYETIANNSKSDKTIVDKLKDFKKGELILKDSMRFKQGSRRM